MSGMVLLGLCLVVLAAVSLRGVSAEWQARDGLPKVAKTRYLETGDLDGLQKRGKLRLLLLNETRDPYYLPRAGSMLDFELRAASEFASQIGLEPVIVYVQQAEALIPALTHGRGDLIASNLTITSELKEQIGFTVPLMHVRHVLLTRVTDTALQSEADLSGRVLAVRVNSPYWASAQQLLDQHPGLRFHSLPRDLSEQRKLELLAEGKIDLTIHDDWAFGLARDIHEDLRVAFPVSSAQPIAWGVRPDAVALKEQLNRYINQEQLVKINRQRYRDDLDGLKEKRVLRVVTRNNAANYFLWRGELLGFEYEMAREFARQQKLRLEIVVAPEWDDLIPMVAKGQADIAAAFITPTDMHRAQGVEFSAPYSEASELVVTRAGDEELDSPADLIGRTFYVRQSSSHWQTLSALQSQYYFAVKAIPEDEETATVIDRIASGEYDLTLMDSNILDIELTGREDIKAVFPLGTDTVKHAWAVRADNPELLAAVNDYLKKQYRSTFYNLTYEKYFKSETRMRQHRFERVTFNDDNTFSPYDELIKKYAAEYGFDWRLLAAQMYQESRFEPTAVSWAGAQGLMQVLPHTAKQLGIDGDLTDPETSIKAGIQYLAWMRERFEPELPVQDRMWFTLAGYNAGAGHVRDARRLARQKGWDPDRWFGNVERAMLLLSKPEYARNAQHGYVRGIEPVTYVHGIKERYDAYIRFSENLPMAANAPYWIRQAKAEIE